MDNLLQENHSLLKKLELKKEMEAAYLDEIEQLRSVITQLQREKTSISTSRIDDNSSLLYDLEGRVEKSEEKVALLTKELDLAKKREADLLEQLNSFVNKVDSISECSVTVPEPHNSLAEEVIRLKEELSSKETSNRLEQSKLTRQIQESEDDRQNLQDYIIELDRQLKDCRLELTDTRAQLEALQIQSNSTESTRGNSVFSEIEDRRIRAEKIVVKQEEQINELKLRLRQTETDAKRKLTESIQKLETRYRDRDTNFVDELVAERERLINENTKLSYQVQHLEELQLDQERGALKISKAFNLEGNSQEGVISNLERRIKRLKRAQEESTEIINGLRQRLLDSGQIRRKLQNELWHSIDENTSLSEQISELRKQLTDLRSEKVSDNLKANNVELKIKQSSPSLTESAKLDIENRDPQKSNSNKVKYCTNPLKETSVELSKSVHKVDRPGAGIQSKDVPQNCATS
ncbi:putative tropomyosin [Schistosoma mansoni]|uniref:Putative tropomyosin n=1 Tax=Schistosoma mansoni TaxID=6183 RepID=G4VSF6_SCHMA|nr:putative tropomyosin [Schistosoma mansoni]|eukprot:XP_018655447.1 putative tropomyosin [Schistosoma mansoni]